MHLLELLMNSLLSKLVDHSQQVRMLCIRGLGNMVSIGAQKIQAYSTTILSAMMAGMDDKEDTEMKITLEAMNGLSKILSLLDETSIRQILINICLRIRPCFEKVLLLSRKKSDNSLFVFLVILSFCFTIRLLEISAFVECFSKNT